MIKRKNLPFDAGWPSYVRLPRSHCVFALVKECYRKASMCGESFQMYQFSRQCIFALEFSGVVVCFYCWLILYRLLIGFAAVVVAV